MDIYTKAFCPMAANHVVGVVAMYGDSTVTRPRFEIYHARFYLGFLTFIFFEIFRSITK